MVDLMHMYPLFLSAIYLIVMVIVNGLCYKNKDHTVETFTVVKVSSQIQSKNRGIFFWKFLNSNLKFQLLLKCSSFFLNGWQYVYIYFEKLLVPLDQKNICLQSLYTEEIWRLQIYTFYFFLNLASFLLRF